MQLKLVLRNTQSNRTMDLITQLSLIRCVCVCRYHSQFVCGNCSLFYTSYTVRIVLTVWPVIVRMRTSLSRRIRETRYKQWDTRDIPHLNLLPVAGLVTLLELPSVRQSQLMTAESICQAAQLPMAPLVLMCLVLTFVTLRSFSLGLQTHRLPKLLL